MAGRNKRNKETFNSIFRKLCRNVTPEQLQQTDRWRSQTQVPMLQKQLHIPMFRLLSRETRKWYIKDPKGFGEWALGWDNVTKRLSEAYRRWSYAKADEKSRERLRKAQQVLAEQYLEQISRFVSGHEGDGTSAESTPEARVEAILEKRRAKVTSKMARGALWAPGTLIEVKNFAVTSNSGVWGSHSTTHSAGWFFPCTDEEYRRVLHCFEIGKPFRADHIEIPQSVINTQKNKDEIEVVGMITEEHVLSGISEDHYYSWVRLIKVLTDKQVWLLVLHPTLEAKGLGKWITALNGASPANGLTCKTITVKKKANLLRAIRNEGKEGHEPLVCKDNTF